MLAACLKLWLDINEKDSDLHLLKDPGYTHRGIAVLSYARAISNKLAPTLWIFTFLLRLILYCNTRYFNKIAPCKSHQSLQVLIPNPWFLAEPFVFSPRFFIQDTGCCGLVSGCSGQSPIFCLIAGNLPWAGKLAGC